MQAARYIENQMYTCILYIIFNDPCNTCNDCVEVVCSPIFDEEDCRPVPSAIHIQNNLTLFIKCHIPNIVWTETSRFYSNAAEVAMSSR